MRTGGVVSLLLDGTDVFPGIMAIRRENPAGRDDCEQLKMCYMDWHGY